MKLSRSNNASPNLGVVRLDVWLERVAGTMVCCCDADDWCRVAAFQRFAFIFFCLFFVESINPVQQNHQEFPTASTDDLVS